MILLTHRLSIGCYLYQISFQLCLFDNTKLGQRDLGSRTDWLNKSVSHSKPFTSINCRGRFQGTKRNFNGGRAGQNQVVATGVKSRLGSSNGRLGNSKGRLGNSNVRLGNTQHLTDARDKLIAKARKTDAREKLIQKARQTDARARINAKRVKTGPKGDDDSLPQNVKIGGLKRTISNKGQKTQSLQVSSPQQVHSVHTN